jgi:hypothetical protein
LMRPIWPHGHATRISMELHPKNSPGRTGAESHCTTKLVQAPHYLAYTVRADGARRPDQYARQHSASSEAARSFECGPPLLGVGDEKAPGSLPQGPSLREAAWKKPGGQTPAAPSW